MGIIITNNSIFVGVIITIQLTYLKRHIDESLEKWVIATNRKPLLLRGARQVGKSSAVRQLGKNFKQYIELNLDEDVKLLELFERKQVVTELITNLEIYLNVNIVEGETLLFIDEIQTSLSAIKMLRYFYEKLPTLHVIGAGSLLEFALQELPTFGVGRISILYVYPLSFDEFLWAMQENKLYQAKKAAMFQKPMIEQLHNKLNNLLRIFIAIGGMPEAVKTYCNSKNMLEVQQVIDAIITTIKIDFAKYKKSANIVLIRKVFDAIAMQNGGKFQYNKVEEGIRGEQVKDALQLLILAGIAIPVVHTSANGLPLGAEQNYKFRKIIYFDSGIYQRIAQLNIADLIINEDLQTINKGMIAELFFGLEYLKYGNNQIDNHLFFWQKIASSANAEVDYVINYQQKIIPVEIKSSTKGSMQSLFEFMKLKNSEYGIRCSLENYSTYDKIKVLPLHSISNLF